MADRIRVSWSCQVSEVRAALDEHSDAIAREVLAVQFGDAPTRRNEPLNEHHVGFALDKHEAEFLRRPGCLGVDRS